MVNNVNPSRDSRVLWPGKDREINVGFPRQTTLNSKAMITDHWKSTAAHLMFTTQQKFDPCLLTNSKPSLLPSPLHWTWVLVSLATVLAEKLQPQWNSKTGQPLQRQWHSRTRRQTASTSPVALHLHASILKPQVSALPLPDACLPEHQSPAHWRL